MLIGVLYGLGHRIIATFDLGAQLLGNCMDLTVNPRPLTRQKLSITI